MRKGSKKDGGEKQTDSKPMSSGFHKLLESNSACLKQFGIHSELHAMFSTNKNCKKLIPELNSKNIYCIPM